MLKTINILSLVQAHASLQEETFKDLLSHNGIEIKLDEINDLRDLINALRESECDMKIFDGFHVGYEIPQIGKEFDLLRIGEESIVNVELKRNSTKEKIWKQLKRNKYYLSSIGRETQHFTFLSETKDLFHLQGEELVKLSSFDLLIEALTNQKIDEAVEIDKLFNPADYLVSPFNSTAKFLKGEYFLTHQQEEISKNIISLIKTSNSAEFISLSGSAGTGKTLLIYDIARKLLAKQKKPLIIHCAQLNEGHQTLIDKGWDISAIKNYKEIDLKGFDVVIVDEAQRLKTEQLEQISDVVRSSNGICIFAYDKRQTLALYEAARNISDQIQTLKPLTTYTLSTKIRTNKEIASFIKMLFEKTAGSTSSSMGNVEINFFSNVEDAKSYLCGLNEERWEVLRFTPSLYKHEFHEEYIESSKTTSHGVIGQEFDAVAVAIDKNFTYDSGGQLTYLDDIYYFAPNMLFQNLTRARKKLNIVIIENEEVLNRCLTILQ